MAITKQKRRQDSQVPVAETYQRVFCGCGDIRVASRGACGVV